MKIKINNALTFTIYVWTRCLLIIFILFFLLGKALKLPQLIEYNSITNQLIIIGVIFVLIFEYIIKPSYFEAQIINGKIIFKYYEPSKKNGLWRILMVFYKKDLKEHIIERQSYNNYKITIERLGFMKKLVFQKIDNGKIYESTPINISFLSTRKYTELLLSIDRLHEKMNLN